MVDNKDGLAIAGWKFTRGRLKYSVDEKFFFSWTTQMAYILGFTYADGSIYKTSLSWEVQEGDLDILQKIRKAMECSYPIRSGHKGASWRLRVSNQVLLNELLKLGMLPKKLFRYQIPSIPREVLRHFVRGFLDGDGWIVIRKDRNEIDVGFCGCSKSFLVALNNLISSNLEIKPGLVRRRTKITPKLKYAVTYQLEFYSSRAFKVVQWVYGDLALNDLFLDRKYKKYLEAKGLNDFLSSGSKKIRVVQRREGRDIRQILDKLYSKEGLDGVQIAKALGVHSSSIYRWLAQTGIKYPIRRVRT